MTFNNTKLKLSNFIEWVCITLLILLSGCVYFTQAYRKETVALLMAFTLLYAGVRHIKLRKKQLSIFGIISGMLLFNFIVNSGSMTISNVVDYSMTIASLACIAIISSGMPLKEFKDKYIGIMDVIGIISIVCFYIQLTNKALVYQLGSTNVVEGYLISPFHTWGWTYVFERNAGPFWEQGAFQGYLFLAILFILNERNLKKYKKSLLILVTTVITTMSTTGYVLLAIIAGYFAMIYWQQSLKKSKNKIFTIIRVAGVIVLAIAAIRYIGNSNVVSNKFTFDNQSFSIRMLHLKHGIDIIGERMIRGFGISSPILMKAIKMYGMNSNSVGLFAIVQYFGVIFGTCFIGWNFYRSCKIYNKLNKIVILVIFFILHMTEGLLLFPIYMSFLFWNCSDIRIKKGII